MSKKKSVSAAAQAVEEEFESHPQLMQYIMLRQAGTMAKAIPEGIMNSIDAGATKVNIAIDTGSISIEDNGRGFQTAEEIQNSFKVFGKPHELDEDGEVADAKYGEFRIGRGQLFAQGHNVWLSGPFEIETNIKKRFGYTRKPADKPFDGCRIDIDLFERMGYHMLNSTIRGVEHFAAYTDVDVYVNGRKVNQNPMDASWTDEDEVAYYNLSTGKGGGVKIYQQGVYVETINSYDIGVTGVIVSKERLKLNTARNQVMRDCPRWKQIYDKIKASAKVLLKDTNKPLNSMQVQALLYDLQGVLMPCPNGARPDLPWGYRSELYSFWKENSEVKFLPDSRGNLWSLSQLQRVRKFDLQPSGKIAYSFARRGDRLADRVMQRYSAVVFDEMLFGTLLKPYNVEPSQFLNFVFSNWMCGGVTNRFEYHPLETVSEGVARDHRLVDPKKVSKTNAMKLACLTSVQYHVKNALKAARETTETRSYTTEIRTLRLGDSMTADAWTDGSTYVAISKQALDRFDGTLDGFQYILALLTHELCHDAPDSDTHEHSFEFYKLFHDTVLGTAFREAAKALHVQWNTRSERLVSKLHKKRKERLAISAKAAEELAGLTEDTNK